ncbi:hypothetical protein E2C01_009975 [Portunus trituberculatus]|uniref:Uncharacterized protein n=1 Tax=Portunus trituberculatus TaxID=210409 RepID=A0A5B7D752_PORTR|nr:hypothetical protein [Portunus trituberculatus]
MLGKKRPRFQESPQRPPVPASSQPRDVPAALKLSHLPLLTSPSLPLILIYAQIMPSVTP